MASAVSVGIDVSKASLDLAVHDEGYVGSFANSASGIDDLAAVLEGRQVHRVVLEASGGYEALALQRLHAKGLAVVLIQPARARYFARSLGRLAKTDPIDAGVLAHMAAVAVDHVPLWQPLNPEQQALRALVCRREQVKTMVDAERKRLQRAPPQVREGVERTLRFLKSELKALNVEIQTALRASEAMACQAADLLAEDGVGLRAAVAAALPNWWSWRGCLAWSRPEVEEDGVGRRASVAEALSRWYRCSRPHEHHRRCCHQPPLVPSWSSSSRRQVGAVCFGSRLLGHCCQWPA